MKKNTVIYLVAGIVALIIIGLSIYFAVAHNNTSDNRYDTKNITIQYDLDSGKINSVLVNSTEIDIKDVLTTIPIVKVNGIKKVNMQLLESIIKNKENKC